ncbi:MAG TPA: type II secretion system F family protein [Acidobacteriota bacterium]|nr:type II secretion system F family protein [Acidobacteriota bacterium]
MGFFEYKAVTPEGKVVEGTLEAADEQTVMTRLREQGQLPIRVVSSEAGGTWSIFSRRKRVPRADLLVFTQELSTLLKAGLPLDRSLSILSELTENQYLREIVKDVLREVKAGKSLSEAFGAYPHVFPKVYVNMIKAGEVGGALDEILMRLSEYLERSEELRSYFVSALIYPAILAGVGAASIIIMITFVIPKFAEIFENAGAPIPLPMKIMLGISGFLTSYWWLLVGLIFGSWYLTRRYLRTPQGRMAWDRRLLKLPLLGGVYQKLEVSRIGRTLGTLLASAVPLIQSLNIVKDVIGNQVMAAAMEPIKSGVKKGEGLAGPVREAGVFPPFALHLLQVGEETGRLDVMLLQIAETYDRELRTALKRLIALFEPAIILLMGIVIGTMVVSMLYSIFSINDVPL